jgi:ribosomal protein S8
MPALNVLSNLFTTIFPASRFSSDILRVMQKHRYIGEFEQSLSGSPFKPKSSSYNTIYLQMIKSFELVPQKQC